MTDDSPPGPAPTTPQLALMGAACLGTLVAGAIAGRALGPTFDLVAAIGFAALLLVPAFLAACVLARMAWRSWGAGTQPEAPSDRRGKSKREVAIKDERDARYDEWLGGFAASILTLSLGTAAFAWMTFRGTWLLASWTQFKPNVITLAQPVVAVLSAVVLVLAAIPVQRVLAMGIRAWGVKRRAKGKDRVLTVARVIAVPVIIGVGATWTIWRFVVAPRLAPEELATRGALGPVWRASGWILGAIAAWWMMRETTQPGTTRGPMKLRRAIARASIALVIVSVGVALVTAKARPKSALAVSAEHGVAGRVLETIFDGESIRDSYARAFAPTKATSVQTPHDVVLIVVDGMRADRTSAYHGPASMPVFHEIAARGTVFTWAFAPTSVQSPALASMMVGLGSEQLRGDVVTRKGVKKWNPRATPGLGPDDELWLDPRHVTLADRLSAAGYETALFATSGELFAKGAKAGLARGFETVGIGENSAATMGRAVAFLQNHDKDRTRTRPMLLVVQIDEPQQWVKTGADQPSALVAYDKALIATDTLFGSMVIVLSQRPPTEAPVFVVAGAFGQGLGDHAARTDGTDLYNSQTRVALVMTGPGISQRESDVPTSTASVPAIIMGRAGFAVPPVSAEPVVTTLGGDVQRAAIVDGGWKLIETGSTSELFDLTKDAYERANVLRDHVDISERLTKELAAQRRTAAPF